MSTGQNPVTSARKPAKRKRGRQHHRHLSPKAQSEWDRGHTQRVLSLKQRSSIEQSSTLIKQLNRAFQEVLDEKALIES